MSLTHSVNFAFACVNLLIYTLFFVCYTVPIGAPENVQPVVINSTLAEVHWDPVLPHLIRGYLKGYKVQCDGSHAV